MKTTIFIPRWICRIPRRGSVAPVANGALTLRRDALRMEYEGLGEQVGEEGGRVTLVMFK
jgi:hypothetical protein